MARNVAIFLQVPRAGGRQDDIKCDQFFGRGDALRKWQAYRAQRIKDAPAGLAKLHGDSSQAAAHLSWRRIDTPEVQAPSTELTKFLMALWAEFVTDVPQPYRQHFLEAWHKLHKGRERHNAE
jgi:hypothetical protein